MTTTPYAAIKPYANEPFTDFGKQENIDAMHAAIAK